MLPVAGRHGSEESTGRGRADRSRRLPHRGGRERRDHRGDLSAGWEPTMTGTSRPGIRAAAPGVRHSTSPELSTAPTTPRSTWSTSGYAAPPNHHSRLQQGGYITLRVVIRPMQDGDVEAIVALSLRAWEPVFASIHDTVGERIFNYSTATTGEPIRRATCAGPVPRTRCPSRTLTVGWSASPPSTSTRQVEAEIFMVAVDPDAQGAGVGTQLTLAAVEQIREAGKRVLWSAPAAIQAMRPPRAPITRRASRRGRASTSTCCSTRSG